MQLSLVKAIQDRNGETCKRKDFVPLELSGKLRVEVAQCKGLGCMV